MCVWVGMCVCGCACVWVCGWVGVWVGVCGCVGAWVGGWVGAGGRSGAVAWLCFSWWPTVFLHARARTAGSQVSTALSKCQAKYKALSARHAVLSDTHTKHADSQHIKYVKNVVLRFLALYSSSDTAKCVNLVPLLAEMLEMTEAERKTLALTLGSID